MPTASVLLDRGLDDLLRRLVETGVDDLHPGVAKRPGDDLRAAIVTVKTRLRDHHSDLARHGVGGIRRCVWGHRLLARLAEPRQGLLGLPRRTGCCSTAGLACWRAARAGAVAHGRGDRDPAPPPPRPLRRSRPLGLGQPVRAGRVAAEAQALAAAGQPGQLRPTLALLGSEDMFDRAFEVSEYGARVPFTAAGLEITAVPVDTTTSRRSASGSRATACSPTPATAARRALAELARDADLLLSEATLENGGYDGRVAHLSPKEAARRRRTPAPSGRPHPPAVRARNAGVELAHDGLELEF